jgi:hypothetical protein
MYNIIIMDNTKISSQQMVARKGYPGNPMGLYNYESYTVSVPWNMSGWASPINAVIDVVKVNDLVTIVFNGFNNAYSGATTSAITSGSYRLPKRFLPKFDSPNVSLHCPVSVVVSALPLLGVVQISNNPSNPLDLSNGLITFRLSTTNGFSDLSARPLASSVSYKTSSALNE